MGSFKYLIGRIKRMNHKAMFEKIKIVHDKTGKSKVIIFFDMVGCGIKYQSGYIDYDLFEMYNLNKKQRKTVMTRGKNNAIIKKLNDAKYNHYLLNKPEFNKKFNRYINRDWLLLTEDNKKDFLKFIKNHKDFMAKPTSGTCGKGIEKIHVADYKEDELYNYLIDNKLYLMEEIVKQHKIMNELHPYSVNTVRVITIFKDGKANVPVTYLRIGNGKFVDNFNSGGMVVPVDEETGYVKYPALDKVGNLYKNHPATNTPIIGFQIPMWNDVLKIAKEASSLIPELGIVGWDVCITDKGPILIEGNEFPGHDIYQLPPHRTNGIGVLPKFEKYLK